MADESLSFAERLRQCFDGRCVLVEALGEITLEVAAVDLLDVARTLRDDGDFRFEQLIDVCGVDYLGFGQVEWDTTNVSSEGSRVVLKDWVRADSVGMSARMLKLFRSALPR